MHFSISCPSVPATWDTHWQKNNSGTSNASLDQAVSTIKAKLFVRPSAGWEQLDLDYLTPPPLTPAQLEAIYGTEDAQADQVGRAAFKALRAAAARKRRSNAIVSMRSRGPN